MTSPVSGTSGDDIPRPDVYLVKVARELVDRLVADDSEPVVIVRIVALDDGTHEMVFRTPDRVR